MKTGTATILAMGILATFSSVAAAQSNSAVVQSNSAALPFFYLGGGLGANVEERNHFLGGGASATDTYHPGPVGIMNFGYGFGNGWRLELEPGYRQNQLDEVNRRAGTGRTQMATLMGNALYDFNYTTPVIPLKPHIGAGVGYAHVWDRSGLQSGNSVSGSTDVLAYQAIGGVDYAVSPKIDLGLDYHYLVARNANFHVNNGLTTHAGDLDNHTFLVTFRYKFGEPAPAPMAYTPPPAPVPSPALAAVPAALPAARPFEVYFDFDRSTLTPEARATVQQAAANAQQGQATRIVATGHTDTVGTDGYNMKLSIRRANSVRAELIKDGIPGNEIATSGVGESDLAVPTPPGINEPRNRRVEIVVQAPGA
jgi:outer membrane protein OmpA-like peptidoglycan-associated protein